MPPPKLKKARAPVLEEGHLSTGVMVAHGFTFGGLFCFTFPPDCSLPLCRSEHGQCQWAETLCWTLMLVVLLDFVILAA
eukprot:scaffold77443_cov18-Tisochrysis_lutea.AAC.1